MVGFLKAVFGWTDASSYEEHPERIPSFSDFSANCGRDHESEIDTGYPSGPVFDQAAPKAPAKDPWRSVFTPGKNYNMAKVGASYYDNVSSTKPSPAVWDQIVRAEHMKRISFAAFDTDKSGFITKANLRDVFGKDAQVDKIIEQADHDGDGMINFEEFSNMMRNTSE